MKRWIHLVVAPIVFAGCASLTPEQSGQLKEAQQFVDEVTTAYGTPRVKVIVTKSQSDGYTAYWPNSALVLSGRVRTTLGGLSAECG
jgi:hypothetical protein